MTKKNVALTKFKFTQQTVDALPLVSSGKSYAYDERLPGLCVRITPTGKFYAVRVSVAREEGKRKVDVQRAIPNGCTKIMTVEMARSAARSLIGDLTKGIDESQQRRDKRRAEKAAKLAPRVVQDTFSEALEAHLGKSRERNLKARTIDEYKELLRNELASVKDTPMPDIDRALVTSLHASIAIDHGPTRRDYALRMMRAVCRSWTKTETLRDWSGFKLSTKPRQTSLEPNDGPLIYKQLMDRLDTHPSARFALVLMLTGSRHGELAKVKVRDVNPQAMTMTLLDTKNHKDHTIYMSEQTAAIVLPMLLDSDGDKRDPDAPLFITSTDPRFVLSLVEKSLFNVWGGGTHVTPHDLRKLCAITLNHKQYPMATIQGVLNHTPPASNTLFNNYIGAVSRADLRAAWAAVGAYYSGSDSNVVNFPATAQRDAA